MSRHLLDQRLPNGRHRAPNVVLVGSLGNDDWVVLSLDLDDPATRRIGAAFQATDDVAGGLADRALPDSGLDVGDPGSDVIVGQARQTVGDLGVDAQ